MFFRISRIYQGRFFFFWRGEAGVRQLTGLSERHVTPENRRKTGKKLGEVKKEWYFKSFVMT